MATKTTIWDMRYTLISKNIRRLFGLAFRSPALESRSFQILNALLTKSLKPPMLKDPFWSFCFYLREKLLAILQTALLKQHIFIKARAKPNGPRINSVIYLIDNTIGNSRIVMPSFWCDRVEFIKEKKARCRSNCFWKQISNLELR